jgi:hypothetical protein
MMLRLEFLQKRYGKKEEALMHKSSPISSTSINTEAWLDLDGNGPFNQFGIHQLP